jgi:alpha-galactosidase
MAGFHHGLCKKRKTMWIAWWVLGMVLPAPAQQAASFHNSSLSVSIRPTDGVYEIRSQSLKETVLEARVAAEIDHRWVHSTDYPHHPVAESAFTDPLGAGHRIAVAFS